MILRITNWRSVIQCYFSYFPLGLPLPRLRTPPPPLEVQEEVGRGLFAARSHGFEGLRGSAVWGIYKPEK